MDTFATQITCMDGRIQQAVQEYLKSTYNKQYIDTITMAGPVKILAQDRKEKLIENLRFRSDVSVFQHFSSVIAVVGHHDCAGIKEDNKTQKEFIKKAVVKIKSWYPDCEVIGIWFDVNFKLQLLETAFE